MTTPEDVERYLDQRPPVRHRKMQSSGFGRLEVPACKADACEQGRVSCPAPDACRVHEAQIKRTNWPLRLLVVVMVCAGAWLSWAVR